MIEDIRLFLKQKKLFAPATAESIQAVESKLRFEIPSGLRNCLMQIANGGFGPGYGLIGVGTSGYQSDFGDLAETYKQIESDKASEGEVWPESILPFCEWGDAMFSCLDRNENVLLLREFRLFDQGFSLGQFFDKWINGDVDVLLETGKPLRVKKVTNPFSGKETTFLGEPID